MSLRFRKRLKVLPGIYLNLGKNRISTTIGPRGANINISKNGIYLNTGIPGTGISNREKLFSGDTDKPNLNNSLPTDDNSLPPIDKSISPESTEEIITSEGLVGLQEHLEESRNQRQLLASEIKDIEKTLSELQLDLSKKQKGFFSLFTKKETLEDLENDINETTQSVGNLRTEYEESKADINIQFAPEIQDQYTKLTVSCSELAKSNKIWDITNQTANTELKSSAKLIVERKEVKFQWCTVDFIKTKYSAFQLQNSNGSDLIIFPAFILVLNKQNEINLIDLKELNFNFHKQRFTEQTATLPIDSKIIDYTWYKVNKDGSRDLRFVGNYQIPIVNYGALNFSSSKGLNETYYVSNVDLAENFANEFRKYLDLLNGNEHKNANVLQTFSKQYYDLLVSFSDQLISITKKLAADETLFDKLKIHLGETPASKFIPYCIIYDLCQVTKILNIGNYNKDSLETIGLILSSNKILPNAPLDLLSLGYETIIVGYSKGLYSDIGKSIVDIGNNNKPIDIKINTKNANVSLNKTQNNLSLPIALKVIDHPLFDEYVATLNHFANIVAKADNTVSKEEETILKEIFQMTHNPLPVAEDRPLNISEVNEKESLDDVLNELETLVGLDDVKQEVKSLINYIKVQKEREKIGLRSSQVSYHCVFTGSPGTGKTTMARIVAKIYMHLGILTKGHLVETDRSGLVAEYVGQTSIKVNKTVDSALDGVLFIDEAYSLVGENRDDFGKEAVATLIKRMEDDRDKLIVILAGYTQEMKNFIEVNPGLESRFNRYIVFADYSPIELTAIFKLNCDNLDYRLTDGANKKLMEIVSTAFTERDKSFGNGRFARNLFEKTIEKQANRIASVTSLTKEILITITGEDINE